MEILRMHQVSIHTQELLAVEYIAVHYTTKALKPATNNPPGLLHVMDMYSSLGMYAELCMYRALMLQPLNSYM